MHFRNKENYFHLVFIIIISIIIIIIFIAPLHGPDLLWIISVTDVTLPPVSTSLDTELSLALARAAGRPLGVYLGGEIIIDLIRLEGT